MKPERQREIFNLMVAGHSKAEISLKLSITPKTVERAFEKLREKYGAHDTNRLYSVAGASLLAGELMATLETVIIYCKEPDVTQAAAKRLKELEEKYCYENP